MLLSYLNCYYRYPALLRKIEAKMRAEEIGDRSRVMGAKFGSLPGWALPTFFLLGREMLINFGMLRPEDAAEDTGYVMDLEATGCHFYLMDDWSSFESRPEFTADKLTGIGLYTSDVLSEGHIPVGMESPDTLADTFEKLTNQLRAATVELWKRTAQ